MKNAKILNERGEEIDAYSTYCPVCGTTNIEQGTMTGQDFDENGWYQTVMFKCKAPKCGHTWHNRIVLAEGGQRFQNW